MGQGCTKDQQALKSILATEEYTAPNETGKSNADGAEDDEHSEEFQTAGTTTASSKNNPNEKKYNVDETFLSPYVQDLLSRLTYCELQILLVSLLFLIHTHW
jgi:hypothetical protein